MRFKVVVSVLTVVGACSCSSTPLMVSGSDGGDGGSGGGDGGDGSVTCSSTKPQTTMGGSCTQPGFVSANADAGAPPPFCVDFTGSGQMTSDTQLSCKTMGGIFSTSTCAASNTAQTVVGYCLKACGTSQETTQYYYNTGTNVAKAQCQALNYVWVSM